MANTKSSKKRININKRNQLRNKYYKTSVKNLLKLFYLNFKSQNINKNDKLKKIVNSINSLMDKGTKKNIFHKNLTARRKAKIAYYMNFKS